MISLLKKFMSVLLAAILVMSLAPVTALAADNAFSSYGSVKVDWSDTKNSTRTLNITVKEEGKTGVTKTDSSSNRDISVKFTPSSGYEFVSATFAGGSVGASFTKTNLDRGSYNLIIIVRATGTQPTEPETGGTQDTTVYPIRFYFEGMGSPKSLGNNYVFSDDWAELDAYLSGGWANIGSIGGKSGLVDNYGSGGKITGDAEVKAWLDYNDIAIPSFVNMNNVADTLEMLVSDYGVSKNSKVLDGYTVQNVIDNPAAFELYFMQASNNYDLLAEYKDGNYTIASNGAYWQRSYHVHIALRAKTTNDVQYIYTGAVPSGAPAVPSSYNR